MTGGPAGDPQARTYRVRHRTTYRYAEEVTTS